jgi:CMP-N,N'-diacetyllegionaminic acid synthase
MQDMRLRPLLAVIPCRGGSKGLRGKNLRNLAGMPLIAHSIHLAKISPHISRCIISTDSEEIAAVAQEHGGDVPFLRPRELAQDDTPMWPVLQHALSQMEAQENIRYERMLLLSPTSPGRLPEDIDNALRILEEDCTAVGVVAASKPRFNPRWVCVDTDSEGYARQSFPSGEIFHRRQDVPPILRVNGLLYLWRRDHVANSDLPRYYELPHRLLEVPEDRAIDIDSLSDLRLAEMMIREGLLQFPWLDSTRERGALSTLPASSE